MSESDDKKGYTIKDRRVTSPDREDRPEPPPAPPAPPPREPETFAGGVDFRSFIMSLGTSAMMQLGAIPHPETQRPEVDLPGAQQTIGLLEMLAAKTKGNLDDIEQRTLAQILSDVRMRFVELSRPRPPRPPR